MLGLFEKKSPEDRVKECLKKRDWDGLARAYYDLGVSAMERDDLSKAALWLSRADTVYSARDETYSKAGRNRFFHKEIVSDCSAHIGELEDAPLLVNQITEQVEEKAEELNDIQIRVWSLLTLARLARTGERLAVLPGCGVLGTLGRCADLVMKSFQEPISQDESDFLQNVCGDLYALSLHTLKGELHSDDGALIPCALVPDYWVRTTDGGIHDIPQVKAELERIWSDYAFVCSGITWAQVAQRINEYKSVDTFQ